MTTSAKKTAPKWLLPNVPMVMEKSNRHCAVDTTYLARFSGREVDISVPRPKTEWPPPPTLACERGRLGQLASEDALVGLSNRPTLLKIAEIVHLNWQTTWQIA